MSVHFTADTHFGHARIIELCKRPFASVEEMDATLIANWNSRVHPGDLVYHVGDFAFKNPIPYLDKLHGRIVLILGNHDGKRLKPDIEKRFESVVQYIELKVPLANPPFGTQKITLCHYALRVWNCSHHGAWHLYGHSHGTLPDDPNSLSFDIGVDCWNFYPLSFAEVAAHMATKKYAPVDHHNAAVP